MRLEPLAEFRMRYSEAIRLVQPYQSGEGSAWGVGDGTTSGRISGRARWVNHPHRRSDGTFMPNAHGVIETDDGETVLFSLQGRTPTEGPLAGKQHLSVLFEAEAERYRWLNDVLAVAEGIIEMESEHPVMRAACYECVHELS
jgi:Protein of unknown function (DUF3237)